MAQCSTDPDVAASSPASTPTSKPRALDVSVTLARIGLDAGENDHEQQVEKGLEALPNVIRRHLLTFLDLDELSGLINASPVYLQQFVVDRDHVLPRIVEQTLGPVIVDAYAVFSFAENLEAASKSNPNPRLSRKYADNAGPRRALLATYAEHTSQRCVPPELKITSKQATIMVDFYSRFVSPLIDAFAREMLLGDLTRRTETEEQRDALRNHVLTASEKLRIIRAVYRYHLFCQVADVGVWHEHHDQYPDLEALLVTWKPWEGEEFLSFYQWAETEYTEKLEDVKADLQEDSPRFADQKERCPSTPVGSFDLDANFTEYLEGVTLRGVSLLHQVLFETKDHETLVKLMQDNLTMSWIGVDEKYGAGILDHETQRERNERKASRRDWMQANRDPLVFQGDHRLDSPPKAWVTMWKGTYSNLYGEFIPDDMRSCGYVFWDAATLETTGADRVLERLWEKMYGVDWANTRDGDPREEMIDYCTFYVRYPDAPRR